VDASWVKKVTGSLEQKARYRRYKARTQQLPENYRSTVQALERYLLYTGSVTKGDAVISMLEDLVDLVEQSAVDRVSIRDIVGEDPVTFAETFLRNYIGGQWAAEERQRLSSAIDQAAEDPLENEERLA
jgi:DNA-binding ferritin-like protein (Dps family)